MERYGKSIMVTLFLYLHATRPDACGNVTSSLQVKIMHCVWTEEEDNF